MLEQIKPFFENSIPRKSKWVKIDVWGYEKPPAPRSSRCCYKAYTVLIARLEKAPIFGFFCGKKLNDKFTFIELFNYDRIRSISYPKQNTAHLNAGDFDL